LNTPKRRPGGSAFGDPAAKPGRGEEASPEPWLAAAGRLLVHAIAAAVFAFPLARLDAVLSAALGASAGALLGPRLARTRLRTFTLLGLFGLLALLSTALADVFTSVSAFSSWLGPAGALRARDALFFGLLAFAFAASLRSLSTRRRSLAVLEVGFVGLAFAQLVVAHRHGAINRPYELADPILASGGDPTTLFLIVGAVATAVVVLLLLSERSVLRSGLHLLVVAAILLLIVGTTRMLELPSPPPSGGGLGLRPNEEPSQGGSGGGGQGRPSDEMEFRDDYDNSNARIPIGVVLFHDEYSPPNGVYYFRQGAFSQYNGRRLVAATRLGIDDDLAATFPSSPWIVPGAPALEPYRTTLGTTVALLADHNRPFGMEAPLRFEPTPNPDPSRFRRTYEVSSAVLRTGLAGMLGANSGDPRWAAETWRHYTSGPEDPRYRDLATRVLSESLPASAQAMPALQMAALTEWLGEVGTYSLQSQHASAEDPTADFLFGDRTGYCVHFAHAAVYLMRSVGLPARVATGYAVEEAARQGGSALLISGEASHAWPEVYLEGLGWVVADVSPQNVISPPPQPPDPELQRLLGELARGQSVAPPDAEPLLPELGRRVGHAALRASELLGALALGLLLLLALVKIWRRLAPAFSREASLARVIYRAELDRLSDLALRRRRGESREAFAARLEALCPSFVALTELHVAAAFGSARAAAGRPALRERAREVRAQLRAARPLWRRALGLILPWTWVLSR